MAQPGNGAYRLCVCAAVMMLLWGATTGRAETISYDNGMLDVSYVGSTYSGTWFANRFTNDYSLPFEITAILVRTSPLPGGYGGYGYLWEDDNGSPGSVIAGPEGAWLSQYWDPIDMSAQNVILGLGESIFAGFQATSSTQIPYDYARPGAGRSWWDQGTDTWTTGGPGGGNLMVRLEGNLVPEPATASLVVLGACASAVVAWRRRKRDGE